MPRYFFHTRVGADLITDPTGEVLRDPDEAWEFARVLILDLLKDKPEQLWLLTASLEITGEDGSIVLEFPFAEAVIEPPDRDTTTKH